MGAFVPITLAGKEYRVAELPRRANREWQRLLGDETRRTLADAGPLESVDAVIDAIAASADQMLDLLIAYDAAGVTWPSHQPVLPERDYLDTHATDRECYEALKKVTGVSFPFGADLLGLLPEIRPALVQAVSRGVAAATVAMVTSLPSSSSARPNTAGSPTISNTA